MRVPLITDSSPVRVNDMPKVEKAEDFDLDRFIPSASGMPKNTDFLLKSAVPGKAIIATESHRTARRGYYRSARASLEDLYTLAFSVSDIRTAQFHLRNEVFRRGVSVIPKFAATCKDCGTVYQQDVEKCPECKSKEFTYPDRSQIERVNEFLLNANVYEQSLVDVLGECEDDINTVDDAFIMVSYDYFMNNGGRKSGANKINSSLYAKLAGVYRMDPVKIKFDLDDEGRPFRKNWFCVVHRDHVVEANEVDANIKCKHCDLPLFPSAYVYEESSGKNDVAGTGSEKRLAPHEAIHWSFFSPSKLYGFSPILSLFEKSLTLIGMDRLLYDHYYLRHVPQGIITTISDNPSELDAKIKEMQANMAQDPSYVPWIAVSARTQQGKTEFVKFGADLEESKYIEVRRELRERISALYGVSNIWQSDVTNIGGFRGESQQLTVMSRVVEARQGTYNNKVLMKLSNLLGVTDWDLMILPPEEAEQGAKVELRKLNTEHARTMVDMGFIAELAEGDTFKFRGHGSRVSGSSVEMEKSRAEERKRERIEFERSLKADTADGDADSEGDMKDEKKPKKTPPGAESEVSGVGGVGGVSGVGEGEETYRKK